MEKRKSSLLLLFVFTIITLFLVAGFLYQSYEAEKIKREKYSDLNAIADMKEGQIVNWINIQKKICESVTKSPFYIDAIAQIIKKNGKTTLKNKIAERNDLIREMNELEDILLVKPDSKILVPLQAKNFRIDSLFKSDLNKTLKSKSTIISSIHKNQINGKIHLEIFSPVKDKEGNVIAVMVGLLDPAKYLFPLIQSWPTESKSAETLLIEKEKDSVVFLNKLRHTNNSPLSMKFAITNKELPAARAVLGETGIFEGVDYRGIEVLSDLRKIKETDWYMITKVDMDEIFSGLTYRTVVIYLVMFLVSMLFAIIAFAYHRSNQKEHFEKLFHSEKELRKAQEEFKITLYSIGDGVISTDVEGKVKQMNYVAENLTGWRETDALGIPVEKVFEIINEDSRKAVESPVKKVLDEGLIVGLANHTLLVSKDGTETPIADSGAPIKDEEGNTQGVVLVFRDQTEERNSRIKLEESARRFLSLFNNMNEGVALHSLILDESGNPVNYRIVDINPQFEKILNLKRDEIVGKIATEAYGVDQPPFLSEYSSVAKDGKPLLMKIYFPPMDKHFEISVAPWSDSGFATIFNDITERVRTEEAIKSRIIALTRPLGDASNVTFADLFELSEIQKIQDSFAEATGVASVITDVNGKPITETSNFCNLCKNIIRKTEKGRINCFKSDAAIGKFHPDGPIIQPCLSGGLWDAGASITVGGKHIANWLIGQVRDENINEEEFLKYADEIGVNRIEFMNALDEVPVMSHKKFTLIANSLFTFANELSLKAYQNIQQARFISERKEIEEKLQSSYNLLSKLSAQVPGVVYQYRLYPDGRSCFPYSSPGITDIYEVTPEEVKEDATPVFGRLHPDDLENIVYTIQESARTQQLYSSEFRVILPLQGLRWRLCNATPELMEDGSTLWYGIIQDITERKEIEEALRLREEKLSVTLNSIGDGVISSDTDGNVTHLNPVAENLTGWKNIDAVGKPLGIVFNIINSETRNAAINPVWRVLEEGIIVGLANHTALISKDGTERQIADSAAPIKDNNGNIIGVVLVFSDVTHEYEVQSKLLENERFLRESQEVGKIGSYTLDINTGIWKSSSTLDQIFGINDEYEKSISGWVSIIHTEWQEIMNDYFAKEVLISGRFDKEYKIVRKSDGVERWVHGFGEVEYDEEKKPIRMIGTIQDVTEITNARIQLEMHTNHLEEIVKERTSQLDDVNSRLIEEIHKQREYELLLQDSLANEKEMNELKNSFISTVSHEFRTPLMAIQLSADLLHRYSQNGSDNKFTNQINSIKNSILNLTKLLDDVLTINRADAGRIKCEPVAIDLKEEIGKIIEDVIVFKKEGHQIVFNYFLDESQFQLDPKLLKYILTNLLSNALKYSPEGGNIELSISMKNRVLQFKVEDCGIGFEEDMTGRIFEPFFRGKNALDIPGTGLGLSIVKKSVELHKGEINYKSEQGVGTTFMVRIPI